MSNLGPLLGKARVEPALLDAAAELHHRVDAAAGNPAIEVARQALKIEYERTGRILKSLSGGGPNNMTPDHVKASPAWKEAKRNYEEAFAAYRNFNARYKEPKMSLTERMQRKKDLRADAATVEGLISSLNRTRNAINNNLNRGMTMQNKDMQRMVDNYNRYRGELVGSDRQAWKVYCWGIGADPGHNGYDLLA